MHISSQMYKFRDSLSIIMPKIKIRRLHLDFYDDEQEIVAKLEWLKEHSGIKTDTELGRWMITQLERRIKEELEMIKQATEAIKNLKQP